MGAEVVTILRYEPLLSPTFTQLISHHTLLPFKLVLHNYCVISSHSIVKMQIWSDNKKALISNVLVSGWFAPTELITPAQS